MVPVRPSLTPVAKPTISRRLLNAPVAVQKPIAETIDEPMAVQKPIAETIDEPMAVQKPVAETIADQPIAKPIATHADTISKMPPLLMTELVGGSVLPVPRPPSTVPTPSQILRNKGLLDDDGQVYEMVLEEKSWSSLALIDDAFGILMQPWSI